MARMRVPAGASSQLPYIDQDSPVCPSLRPLLRQPDLGVRQNKAVKDIDLVEFALSKGRTCAPVGRCRPRGACMKKGRDHDRGTQQHNPRQLSSHIDLLFAGSLYTYRPWCQVKLLRVEHGMPCQTGA